jgi:Short C-terminal domain
MSKGNANEKTGRRALPIILIVLATIIGIVSVFALWAKRQVLETDTWSTTSEQLIQDADVQAALNTFIVGAIFDNVDVQAALAERLPPQAAPLAGPVAGALRSAADNVVGKALEEPKVQQLFVDASAAAQSKLIALIDDKGNFVSTTGGVVTLDLTSVVESVTTELGLPDLAAKLPPQASSIEVMRSDQLSAAQTGLDLLKKVGYVLTALTLLLYAAAILLAGDRRRQTLRAVGFSFLFVGLVVLFARGAGANIVVDSLSGVASSDAAVSAVFNIGTSLMLETAQSIVAYGIVIVLAAWLAGPTHWATSIRSALTPYLRQPSYAYGGLATLLLLLFWWDPVVATHRLVPSLLLIAFAALGTEILRRQVIREFPDRVTPGSPAGAAQGIAARMREAREPRVATAGAPAPATSGDSRLGEIERLAGLRDSGALTEEEFAAEKARILAG